MRGTLLVVKQTLAVLVFALAPSPDVAEVVPPILGEPSQQHPLSALEKLVQD